MELITETYLGWTPYTHAIDCPAPLWDTAEIRYDEGAHPPAIDAAPHGCTSNLCDHGPTFQRVRLRLLCRDCDTVHMLAGEGLNQVTTHTSVTGWGQTPARFGDVWLWPGRPAIREGEPSQYLVTRQPQALTIDTVYGIVTGYRDATGARRWLAGAQPDSDGAHLIDTLRWRHSSNGLTTVDEAAEWIATAGTGAQRPLEVAV